MDATTCQIRRSRHLSYNRECFSTVSRSIRRSFETVTKENEQYIPKSEWQVKTHFQKQTRALKTPITPVTTPDISPDISILPPQIQTLAPQMTPELEQFIADQPLPEPEFEPTVIEPVVELEAPLHEQ
jgi:hypothetical protein